MFFRYLWQNPRFFAAAVFLVVFSVCCHEFMHALVALKFGDDTAARRGHLTLNPFKQMGWLSLVMLLFIGIAWGQVPVNPLNFRSRAGRVLTSLAGPLTNLGLWAIFAVLSYICFKVNGEEHFACNMLVYGAIMNFALFVFNLLPIPGLDGFNVLTEFFPRLTRRNSELAKGAFLVLMALLFAFADRLFDAAKIVTALLLLALEKVVQ
jgi:Zn-dependent protease